jgi:hypothetical protein
MKAPIKIFADFNNTDRKHRVRLTTVGTLEDLERMNIKLEPGLELILDDNDELVTHGIVEFSEEENIWVAKINWDEFK